MMYEKYACCDICLMIGYGWIVGWTMLMVSMILIMYNDDLLELVLLRIGMRKSIWYVNMFEFEPLGWSGLKWWDSDFVNCGKVSMCELRRLDVEIDIFWLISKKRDENGMFWLILKRVGNGLFENGTLCFLWKIWFLGILWWDITWTTDLCFVPNLFRNEIGSGMSMPFEERVKNDLKWESYVRWKIGV